MMKHDRVYLGFKPECIILGFDELKGQERKPEADLIALSPWKIYSK